MEEEKKLYPFRLCTIEDKYAWGTEEFKLADLGYRDTLIRDGFLAGNSISEVMDMYMDSVVGEKVFEWYGRQFPVQLKYLKVDGRSPLVVHPGDELAGQRYDFLGKEKCWYVQEASDDALLYLGFRELCDADSLCRACADGKAAELLNAVKPEKGRIYHIAPGTVHGAAGKLQIVEVSESSPLDFLVWNWGEPGDPGQFDEDLDLVSALDFINYGKYSETAIENFSAELLPLSEPLRFSAERYDSFSLYACLKGRAAVQDLSSETVSNHVFAAGEAVLVPADCTQYVILPELKDSLLMEIRVENCGRPDPYINPDAEPRLPDGDD